MAYNVIDIIDKLTFLKRKVKNIYIETYSANPNDYRCKIVCNTLVKYQDKHIKHYNEIKKNLIHKELEEIDFVIYDKISFLIDKYKNSIYLIDKDHKSIKDILKLALKYENENKGLIIDIQGRLVKKEQDTRTVTYSVLSDILKKEQMYIYDLTKILQDY
ncbi:hypothetical protein RBU49_14540 [Clostridium sp. MB40-C1]|uniref:hypothetical protein n=1 Tax=Clostridium sp. MB40-C1 TaxID=3070996 RepID=UPI0027E128E8|nr:hypothetical protein [Clostridium sp. MB40-C1]WMJ80044.1 hypothetical protein RBU49_14540 [Clostridium sp. MB40-C1]